MIAVIVEVEVKPERLAEFTPRMELQAGNSVELEPLCHQFDVWQAPDAPEKVTLYEVYENRAAFDAHLATEHFKDFDAAVAEMLVSKTVRILDEVRRQPG